MSKMFNVKFVANRYGTVCARNNMFEYQTFPNYCAMKNVDCSGRSGEEVFFNCNQTYCDLSRFLRDKEANDHECA